MRVPHPRFTLRWLMVMVAIAGFEFGLWSFLGREALRAGSHLDWWSEVAIQLAFLNLLIGGPACVFFWAIQETKRSRLPGTDVTPPFRRRT
jgi:hypothetical protein